MQCEEHKFCQRTDDKCQNDDIKGHDPAVKQIEQQIIERLDGRHEIEWLHGCQQTGEN